MGRVLTAAECFAAGYDAGWSAASWTDLPDAGAELPPEVDYVGAGPAETPAERVDAWVMLASHAENNARCFSPWEYTAAAINARDEKHGEGSANAGWEAYDRGVWRGIDANRRKRFPLNRTRSWA